MKFYACVVIFSIFSFGCNAISLSCVEGSNKCENSTENAIENITESVILKRRNKLEELKENVGRVGNKLEGIVYEVLKDILQDDFNSSAEFINGTDKSNNLVKETETAPNIFLQKLHPASLFMNHFTSSVIEDDVIHSNKSKKFEKIESSNSNELTNDISTKVTTTLATKDNTSRIKTTEDTIFPINQSTTENSLMKNAIPSSAQEIRKRRMIQENTEQSRSVESFMESNLEKDINYPKVSPPSDTMFHPDIPLPREHNMIRGSKEDTVRRDPKKESTDGKTSKKPQDEVSMRYQDTSGKLDGKITNVRLPQQKNWLHNTVNSSGQRKSSFEIETSTRRRTPLSEEHFDSSFQDNQGMKEIPGPNQDMMNQRSNLDKKTDYHPPSNIKIKNTPHSARYFNHGDSAHISDLQLPLNLEMMQGPSNNEILVQRSDPDISDFSSSRFPMKQIHIPNDGNMNQRTSNSPQGDIVDSKLGQSYVWGNQPTNCYEKNNRDDIIEKQHIEDLKYEVSKLRSVVDLLKEQQRLINSFDGDKKTMNSQEMMQVLNQLNQNNEKPIKLDKSQHYEIDTATETKHEELGQIKVQLKEAIDNLNRTKEILDLEHKKEINLETELKTQKTEINWLKLIIENFIISQAKKKLKDGSSDEKVIEEGLKPVNETNLVGARNPMLPQNRAHNRTIPSTVKLAEEKLIELEKMRSRENSIYDSKDREINSQLKNLRVSSPKTRASSMSNLAKLLDNISDKQSKNDDDDSFQMKLLEALKEVRKKKDEEISIKDLVKKLQMNNMESKSEDDMLLKFQRALKALDNPSGKSDDLDIEDQLKALQREINKLKSTDDVNLFSGELKSPSDDNSQLQLMLTKLIANNPQLQGMKLPPITPQQLMQLQKKFGKRPAAIIPSMIGGVGIPGDFGATQPAYPAGFGKVGPLYGSFGPGPYSSNMYGKDLDVTSPVGAYPSSYGLGEDLSRIMLYGTPSTNNYISNNGYTGSNDYTTNNGYLGSNGYSGGSSYGSGSGAASSTHISNYPIPALGIYSATKTPYGGVGMPSYSTIYSSPYKTIYGKPQDGGYSMNPYSIQALSYSNPAYGPKVDQFNNDKQAYGNFFQITQPSSYGSGPPAPYLPPKAIDTSVPEKIHGNQPSYAVANPPYATDKIEELKTQIYALQNAISSYNRPEYTQTAEDKSTIHNLEQQIEELKGIVNSLNGYPDNQQTYGASGPTPYNPIPYSATNDPKNIEGYSRVNEKKMKRSTRELEELSKHESSKIGTKISMKDENHNHSVLKKITSSFRKTFPGSVVKTRRKRSIDDNLIENNASPNVMDKLTTVLREVLDDESDTQPQPGFGAGAMTLNSMNSKLAENTLSNTIPKQTSLQDIKKQIDHLKKQLGTPNPQNNSSNQMRVADISTQTRHASLADPSYGFSYALNPFTPDLTSKPKKLDIFKEIVAKIMDKVIESLPVILQKIFGFAVHELTAYGDDYGSSYGADNSFLAVFKNLGIFGYLPLILLRVVNAVSTFIYILQKNKFLKYFLIPAGVVLLVTGGMVFLIWWMQPGEFYVNYDKLSYDKDTMYGNDYYAGDYRKSNRQIVKTYGLEDGKSILNTYNHGGDTKSLQSNEYPAFYKPNLVVSSDNQIPSYNE